jgi:hypothetical protein
MHSAVFLVWTEGSTTDASPICSAFSTAVTIVMAVAFPDALQKPFQTSKSYCL